MPIETKLKEELERDLDALKSYEVGSEEHKATVDSMTKLMDRAIEMKKIDVDAKIQTKAQENEHSVKMAQMKDDRIDKTTRNILTGLSFLGSLGTIWLLSSAAFTYEEKGTIASPIGKKVLSMLVPKL